MMPSARTRVRTQSIHWGISVMGDPSEEYAINTGSMENGIKLWFDPVVDRLNTINSSFAAGQASAAHGQSMAAGWVAGQGHGDVRDAASSFFSQVVTSLEFLRMDQGQVISSLGTYKDMMLKHIAWAERTDSEHAQNFTNIANNMGGS